MKMTNQNHTDTRHVILFLLILSAGTFLRIWNLEQSSLWVDEVNAAYAGRAWAERGDFSLPSGYNYGRAPVYSVLTGLSIRAFGFSEMSARLPAAVSGLISMILVYGLARMLFTPGVALLAAFLTAFSHFEIGWSRTARMYTLLQAFSLAAMMTFVKAFQSADSVKWPRPGPERVSWRRSAGVLWRTGHGFLLWFGAGVFLCIIAALYVHFVAFLLLGGIYLYLWSMTAVRLFEPGPRRFLNFYSIMAASFTLTGAVLFVFSPAVHHLVTYFLDYIPAWAEGDVTARNRLLHFEFMISTYRFPIGVFFFIGAIQIVLRFMRKALLPLLTLAWIVFFFAFISDYRVPAYFFNVYPVFLIVAAFGMYNLVLSEKSELNTSPQRFPGVLRKWVPKMVVPMLGLLIVISPWFRISLHIPFQGDGVTNMAVTPAEWREAGQLVARERESGDVVLSSLSQTMLFYGIPSDYSLNWSALDLSKFRDFRNDRDQWIDVYSGIPCVDSMEMLGRIFGEYRRGWLIVSQYHLNHPEYIPPEVRHFILENLNPAFETERKTVLVFNWIRNGDNH